MEQLNAIFKMLPVDITFIDANDTVRFFTNEGQVFTRPMSALGRDVMNCHPPEIIPVVRNLIADFKAKKRTPIYPRASHPRPLSGALRRGGRLHGDSGVRDGSR